MKKRIGLLSIVVSVGLGLSGCVGVGGGNLSVPITKRAQDISLKAVKDVKVNAHKDLEHKLSNPKYFNQRVTTLGKLKLEDKKLYNIIHPLALQAQKIYSKRNLPDDIKKNGPKWLTGNVDTLNIILVNTKSGKFNGRYSPFNDLLIINYNDKVDPKLVDFLIAHEFGHAIAMHVSEDKTAQLKILDGASQAGIVSLDVALNKAYIKLKEKQPQLAKLIDKTAKQLKGVLYTDKDIKVEKKLLEERKNSMAAKLAMTANQKDKLEMLGINLQIPLETKLALRKLVLSGLSVSGALKTLEGGVNFASANVLAVTAHDKKQELEADKIALELTKEIGVDTKETACKRFAGNKPAGVFDAHPSYPDRRKNLGCDK